MNVVNHKLDNIRSFRYFTIDGYFVCRKKSAVK